MKRRRLIDTEAITKIEEHLHAIEDIINEAAPNNSYLSISLVADCWLINNNYWSEDDPCEVEINSTVYGKNYTGPKVEDIR